MGGQKQGSGKEQTGCVHETRQRRHSSGAHAHTAAAAHTGSSVQTWHASLLQCLANQAPVHLPQQWTPPSGVKPRTPSWAIHLELPPVGAWRSLNRSSQIVTHRLRWKQGRRQRGASRARAPQGLLEPLEAARRRTDAGAREEQQPDSCPAAPPRAYLFFCAAAGAAARSSRPKRAQASAALTMRGGGAACK